APEVEAERALGESAEPALERTDVGVVDVPVLDERYDVTDRLGPQRIGELGDGRHLRPARREQCREFLDPRFLAGVDTPEDLTDGAARPRRAGQQPRRVARPPGAPDVRAPA